MAIVFMWLGFIFQWSDLLQRGAQGNWAWDYFDIDNFRWHLKIYPPHPTHTHTHTLVTSFLFYITLNVRIHVLVPSEPVPIQTSSKSTASIPASNSNRKTSMKGRSNFSQCLPSLIDWFQTFLLWKVTDMKHTWR